MRVEGDSIDDRGDEAGVGEDGTPLAEREVGPDSDGGFFLPLGDDLEEQFGAAGVDVDVAEFVEQQVPEAKAASWAGWIVGAALRSKSANSFRRGNRASVMRRVRRRVLRSSSSAASTSARNAR